MSLLILHILFSSKIIFRTFFKIAATAKLVLFFIGIPTQSKKSLKVDSECLGSSIYSIYFFAKSIVSPWTMGAFLAPRLKSTIADLHTLHRSEGCSLFNRHNPDLHATILFQSRLSLLCENPQVGQFRLI